MQPFTDPLAELPDYEYIQELGSGSYGKVCKYRRRVGPGPADYEEVAVKFLDRSKDINYELVRREVKNMRLLDHPHVIGFRRVGLTNQYVYIVMELAGSGDFFKFVKDKGRLPEDDARWFFQQLIFGLDYCHRKGVINRDIKLENLLLGRAYDGAGNHFDILKIADFGFSKSAQFNSLPHSKVGTPVYMAPEVFNGTPYDGQKADVWSVGVLLYALLFSKYPFEPPAGADRNDRNACVQHILRKASQGDYELPEGVHITEDCADLLTRLLEPAPDQRYSVENLVNHPWFQTCCPCDILQDNAKREAVIILREQSEEEVADILYRAEFGSVAPAKGPAGMRYGVHGEASDFDISQELDLDRMEHPSSYLSQDEVH